MDIYNIIIIAFIIALTVLSVWWAFNTVRQIEIQKFYCAEALSSIAKLWRRAKFVPEDAKDRESLYLYRDFLRKFDEKECKYPIMVKNGGVRCMTRKEFDHLCGQKPHRPVSILITAASVLIAIVALVVNLTITKNVAVGIGLMFILPVVQIALSFFVMRFNKEKNIYRDGIFQALKENSVNFLSITKPFIIVDAYPNQFGKNIEPLYAVKGELTAEQIAETRDFIVRQKAAETEVVLRNVDNSAEIEQITNPQPVAPIVTERPTATDPQPMLSVEPANITPLTADSEPTVANPTPTTAPTADTVSTPTAVLPPLTREEKTTLIQNLIDDTVQAEVERAQQKVATATQTPEPIEDLPPLPTDAVVESTVEVAAPADDDFSLDAIGQALDAEIAKRNKRK